MILDSFLNLSLFSKSLIGLGTISIICMYFFIPANKFDTAQKISEIITRLGIYAPIVLSLILATCIVACFPFTFAFELAAGFMFGILGGYAGPIVVLRHTSVVSCPLTQTYSFLVIAAAKLGGGLISFYLSRSYLKNFVYQRLSNSPNFAKLHHELNADSLKLAIMLRLSPFPSWMINYGLALTPITYKNFTLATVLAGFPGILRNAYIGSIMKSFLGTGDNSVGDWNYYCMGIITIFTSIIVTRYIYKYFKLVTSSSDMQNQLIIPEKQKQRHRVY